MPMTRSLLMDVYIAAMKLAGDWALQALLRRRLRQGKEDPDRIGERMGRPSRPRPPEPLLWIHGASVGEAQSALSLLDRLLDLYPDCAALVTTGTVNSAKVMDARLPPRAVHQYYPLDHPAWVEAFLNAWKPEAALWIESELWPGMLQALQARGIPAALVNARLSSRSARRWRWAPQTARALFQTFSICLAQSESDASLLRSLGARAVQAPGNLKFGAAPLPYDPAALEALRRAVGSRPVWLYASTHAGEEELACRLHRQLKTNFPNLLTILVPRHPERADDIVQACAPYGLSLRRRGEDHALPGPKEEVYLANTLGELGLFYRLAPLACVGRSFSADGGGGHNPIEPARLGCAVLHGPAVQNLGTIYESMDSAGAALRVEDENAFAATLRRFLGDPAALEVLQDKGQRFAQDQDGVLERVVEALKPILDPALARGAYKGAQS